MYKYYFLYFELAAFLISVLRYQKIKASPLVLFIPLLLLTLIQEFGSLFSLLEINGTNALSLSIFTTIEFIFYFGLYNYYLESSAAKRYFKIASMVYTAMAAANIIFFQGPAVFHTYTYLLGSALIVVQVLYFLYDLFNREEKVDIIRYPMFWVSIGVMFFYLGMFAYYSFFEIVSTNQQLEYINLFIALMNIFNFILYSGISIGILCQKRANHT